MFFPVRYHLEYLRQHYESQRSHNITQSIVLLALESLVTLIIIIMSFHSLFPGNRTWPHAHETEENVITVTVRFWFPLIVLEPSRWYLQWIVMMTLRGYMRQQIRSRGGCLAPSHAFLCICFVYCCGNEVRCEYLDDDILSLGSCLLIWLGLASGLRLLSITGQRRSSNVPAPSIYLHQ